MKTYKIDDATEFFVMGGINGNFNGITEKFKRRFAKPKKGKDENSETEKEANEMPLLFSKKKKMHKGILDDSSEDICPNSLVLVAGNSKIGCMDGGYYSDTFGRLNDILRDNHVYLFFIRGNNDNPLFFEKEFINFSNIKTIPDYSLIKLPNCNILCIGGGISVNRTWLKKYQTTISKYNQKTIFWENEAPVYNKEALNTILNDKIDVDVIVSHIPPSFAYPNFDENTILNWVKQDKSLINDLNKSRRVMDTIYNELDDKKPFVWAYGHYGEYNEDCRGNVRFIALADNMIAKNVGSIVAEAKAEKKNNSFLKEDSLNDIAFLLNKRWQPITATITHDIGAVDDVFTYQPVNNAYYGAFDADVHDEPRPANMGNHIGGIYMDLDNGMNDLDVEDAQTAADNVDEGDDTYDIPF